MVGAEGGVALLLVVLTTAESVVALRAMVGFGLGMSGADGCCALVRQGMKKL